MDSGGVNWTLITIVGAALLALVIAWAALRNRGDRVDGEHGETKRLYEEEDRAHRGESDDVP